MNDKRKHAEDIKESSVKEIIKDSTSKSLVTLFAALFGFGVSLASSLQELSFKLAELGDYLGYILLGLLVVGGAVTLILFIVNRRRKNRYHEKYLTDQLIHAYLTKINSSKVNPNLR